MVLLSEITRERLLRTCGQMGVMTSAPLSGIRMAPPGGQRVGGGSRRSCNDESVGMVLGEWGAVDGCLEFDKLGTLSSADGDVVQRALQGNHTSRSIDGHVQKASRAELVVPRQDAVDGLQVFVGTETGQEA